jgi:hypothetical protein
MIEKEGDLLHYLGDVGTGALLNFSNYEFIKLSSVKYWT